MLALRALAPVLVAALVFPVVAAPPAVDFEVVSSLPPAPPGPGNQGPAAPEIAPSAVPSTSLVLVPPPSRPRPRLAVAPAPSVLLPDRIERPPQSVS